MRRFVFAAALLLGIGVSAFAQQSSISGTVSDPTNALIPGVAVTATNTGTGVVNTVLTNDSGTYNFVTLQPGPYKLQAALQGFQTSTVNNIELGTTQSLRFNITLKLANTAGAVVDVAIDASQVLSQSSSSIGEVLSQERIQALPTVGNNVLDLLEVLPGFRVSSFGSQYDTIAGLGLNTINTTINGLSTVNTRYDAQTYGYDVFTPTVINPDLVGEIKLILAPVDAEYGRGNAQVQIQTRSGTNKYTGAGVWNIQNTGLNANSWSNNHTFTTTNKKRPDGTLYPNDSGWRNTHQITLSYGGPIIKNKTFFFALWDQQITRTREPQNVGVMTDTARQGIFRYFAQWNPQSANNIAPTTAQNATTASYPSVTLDGTPRRPLITPALACYSADTTCNTITDNANFGLKCFSVFGNTKFDGSPFTQADCPGGTALFNGASGNLPWDAFRPGPDPSGYYQRILSLMPRANYFASGDGLNQAQYRYIRGRVGSNNANAIVGAVQATQGAGSDQTGRKQINLKIDENLNSKNRFNVSWQYQMEDSTDNVALWPVCDSATHLSCQTSPLNGFVKRRPQVWTVNGTSTISASLVNEARFGVQNTITNSQNAFTNPDAAIAAEAKSFLLPGSFSVENPGFQYQAVVSPGVGAYAGGPLNVGAEIGNTSPLWSYGDTLSWTHDKHAFKFGAEIRLPRTNGYNIQALPTITQGNLASGTQSLIQTLGNFSCPSPCTTVVNGQLPGFLQTARNNSRDLSYTLSGSVASSAHEYWIENSNNVDGKSKNGTIGYWDDTSTKERRYREQVTTEWDFFVKDDFKLTRHLTLNLGLRYEYYGSPYLRSGLTSAAHNKGDGMFGVALPVTGTNFDTWGLPGSVFLSGYGSGVLKPFPVARATDGALLPLACASGAANTQPGLPVASCDLDRSTTIEFVGPKTPHPDRTAIPNRGDFGPAVGFAWQVPWFGEGKTQIRGGFQITYGSAGANGIGLDTLLGGAPGITCNGTCATTLATDPAVTNAIQSTTPNRAVDFRDVAALVPVTPTRKPGAAIPIYGRSIGFEAYAPSYVSPYTENFTLSLTRNVSRKLTVDIKYVGTLAKKQQGSLNLNTNNVLAKAPDGSFLNKELYDALVLTRAGGDAPLFDQMFAGLNLNVNTTCPAPSTTVCYVAVGQKNANGVLVTGSAQMRRSGTFAAALANGNFVTVANSLLTVTPAATGGGLQAAAIDPLTGLSVNGPRTLRNGCDRMANGFRFVQEVTPGVYQSGSGFNDSNATPLRCFPENYLATNPQFQTATYDSNLGHTNYQSLQLQTNVRPLQGMSFQSTFTWAKNMALSATSYNNPWARNDDYAQSINTAPYEFRTNGTFELPLGPNKLLFASSSGWFARAVEKWQTSIIFNYATGLPRAVTAFQMQYIGAGGNGSQPRPDVVGPWVTPDTKAVWKDTLEGSFIPNQGAYIAFKDPQCTNGTVGVTDTLGRDLAGTNCTLTGLGLIVPVGTAGSFVDPNGRTVLPLLQNPQPGFQGNLGMNTMNTIGKLSLDANASKAFKITESKTLQIRIDSKNIMNHPLMGDPTGFGNLLSLVDNFGKITTKSGSRTFQGQVRLSF